MYIYHRPEMQLDPAKFPGQIVNRPAYPQAVRQEDLDRRQPIRMEDHKREYRAREQGLYLRDVIARIEAAEEAA